MKLFDPTLLGVQPPKEQQHERGKLRVVLRSDGLSAACLGEDRRRDLVAGEIGKTVFQAVIGKPAAVCVEEFMAGAQGVEEGGKISNVHVACGGEVVDPLIERGGLIHGECLVRAVGRAHACGEAGSGEGFVMFQVVNRIIRGADRRHPEASQNALGGEFGAGELLIRLLPDADSAGFIEQLINAEVALQFEMRPVIQRVAQRLRHGGRPGLKFGQRGCVARAIHFRHAVGPHRPPLVMVAFKPDFKQVLELAIFRQIRRRQVAVIIKNRFAGGKLMIQPARGVRGQQKILVDEFHKREVAGRPDRSQSKTFPGFTQA